MHKVTDKQKVRGREVFAEPSLALEPHTTTTITGDAGDQAEQETMSTTQKQTDDAQSRMSV